MGCRIIVGRDDDGNGVECAVFYCSTTGVAFGLVMKDLEEAESFQSWVFDKHKKDLRQLTHSEFESLLNIFRGEREREAFDILQEQNSNYWKDIAGSIK